MRTAHQNVPIPANNQEAANKEFVDTSISSLVAAYEVLFQWNHSDLTQFTLTEPLADGWAATFVAATTTKAEHIRLTSANTGSPSEAYYMVDTALSGGDHELLVVHNFFDTSNQQYVYAVCRGDDIASDRYVAARWEQPAGELVGVYNEGVGDQVAAPSFEMVPSGTSPEAFVVETQMSVRNKLLGKGWGRLSSYGQIDAATYPGLGTSGNVGLRLELPVAASAFQIEIFDLIAYRRKQ